MQAQILLKAKKKKKIIGALALKAAAGKALAGRRQATPSRDVESDCTTVVDDPVPEPTPPPVKPVYDPGISRINAVVEFVP
ncbi:hypothetical protein BSKO_10094 [Bryopsis sp. KO-2023]|nr:hypothetical protein BSKO_10094 [Bryopsis sp. KO-2023]